MIWDHGSPWKGANPLVEPPGWGGALYRSGTCPLALPVLNGGDEPCSQKTHGGEEEQWVHTKVNLKLLVCLN